MDLDSNVCKLLNAEIEQMNKFTFLSKQRTIQFMTSLAVAISASNVHTFAAMLCFIWLALRHFRHRSPGFPPYRVGHHVFPMAPKSSGKSILINTFVDLYKEACDLAIAQINEWDIFTTAQRFYFVTGIKLMKEEINNIVDDSKQEEQLQDINPGDPEFAAKCKEAMSKKLTNKIKKKINDDLIINKEKTTQLLLDGLPTFIRAARPRQLWNEIVDRVGVAAIVHQERKGLFSDFEKEDKDASKDILLRTADQKIEGRTYTCAKYNYADVEYNQTIIFCGGVTDDMTDLVATCMLNGGISRCDIVYSQAVSQFAFERGNKKESKEALDYARKLLASCIVTSLVNYENDKHVLRDVGLVCEFPPSQMLPKLNEIFIDNKFDETELKQVFDEFKIEKDESTKKYMVNEQDEQITARDIWALGWNIERQNKSPWTLKAFPNVFDKKLENVERLSRKGSDGCVGIQVLNKIDDIVEAFDKGNLVSDKVMPVYIFDKSAYIDSLNYQLLLIKILNKLTTTDVTNTQDVLNTTLNQSFSTNMNNSKSNIIVISKEHKIDYFVFFSNYVKHSDIREQLKKEKVISADVVNHLTTNLKDVLITTKQAQTIKLQLISFQDLTDINKTKICETIRSIFSLIQKGCFGQGRYNIKGVCYPSIVFYVIKSQSDPYAFETFFNKYCVDNKYEWLTSILAQEMKEFEASDHGQEYCALFAKDENILNDQSDNNNDDDRDISQLFINNNVDMNTSQLDIHESQDDEEAEMEDDDDVDINNRKRPLDANSPNNRKVQKNK